LYISILSFLSWSLFFDDDSLQLYEISVLPFGCKPIISHAPLLAIVLGSIQDRGGEGRPAADGWLAARHFAAAAEPAESGPAERDAGEDLRVPIAAK
jgi:hypothetical protein